MRIIVIQSESFYVRNELNVDLEDDWNKKNVRGTEKMEGYYFTCNISEDSKLYILCGDILPIESDTLENEISSGGKQNLFVAAHKNRVDWSRFNIDKKGKKEFSHSGTDKFYDNQLKPLVSNPTQSKFDDVADTIVGEKTVTEHKGKKKG